MQLRAVAGANLNHGWKVPLLYSYYDNLLSKTINGREWRRDPTVVYALLASNVNYEGMTWFGCPFVHNLAPARLTCINPPIAERILDECEGFVVCQTQSFWCIAGS